MIKTRSEFRVLFFTSFVVYSLDIRYSIPYANLASIVIFVFNNFEIGQLALASAAQA